MIVGHYWAIKLRWPKRSPVVSAWFQGFESDDTPLYATLRIRRFKFDSREAAHTHARKLAERERSVRISVVHVQVNKRA